MSTIEQAKPAAARGAEPPASGGAGSWWERSRTFLGEVRNEMRRVTWPSRREVYATTIVVILTSIFFGLYLWGLDLALDRGVRWVFSTFGAA